MLVSEKRLVCDADVLSLCETSVRSVTFLTKLSMSSMSLTAAAAVSLTSSCFLLRIGPKFFCEYVAVNYGSLWLRSLEAFYPLYAILLLL